MKRIKKYSFLVVLLFSSNIYALEALNDNDLSEATGQDGISIGVGLSKIQVDQFSIIDKDGLSSDHLLKTTVPTYTGAASFVVAGNSANTPVSVDFLGATSSPTVRIEIDAEGGGSPYANIGFAFDQNVSGIRISPFSVYLAGADSTSTASNMNSIYDVTTLKSDVYKFLSVGSAAKPFELTFHNVNKPSVNLQLGNAPQNRMFLFKGAIKAICANGCPIALIAGATAASFDLKMIATDPTNGYSLNSFYAGLEPDALVLGNTGTSSKMDVGINNLMLGTLDSTDTSFSGLKNSSMGSFGLTGSSITNLKMSVKGL